MAATVRFPMRVGAMVRGQVKRALRSYAFERGYPITIDEEKGFLDSTLYVTIEVQPESDLLRVTHELETWAKNAW